MSPGDSSGTPLVSVVIVNYNRCDDLREAVQSVCAQDYPCIEIVVVDNASQDSSRAMLAAEFPDVTVVPLAENTGMDGYSTGFRRARGSLIFQMDNDSLMPDPRVLTRVVRCFGEGPDSLAVAATRVEEFQQGRDDVQALYARDARQGPVNTGGFHSGGVGFRKAALDQVGSYNRDVFLYGAELFLQMKLLAAGFQIWLYPGIMMLHRSSPVARSTSGVYYEVRNRYWFMRCFASGGQRTWYLPSMVVHDLAYGLLKRMPVTVTLALRDGLLRPLPASLLPPLRSSQPQFAAKIREVGAAFSLFKTIRRALGRRA